MLEMRTFGGLALDFPEQPGLEATHTQSKRLALLAYLALAKPRGYHRRDTLLAIFWPEADESHARQALRQALHVLRTELGSELVLSRGQEEVGLNWDRVWCDAAAFDEAVRSGDHEGALELYRAELLPGFHVADAPDFDRFLDDERAGYRRDAAAEAWTLALSCVDSGDAVGAVRWARMAVAIEPHEEERLRVVIARLGGLGHRVAAVALFEEFSRRLAEQYELEPAPETLDLVASIRARSRAAAPAVPPPLLSEMPVVSAPEAQDLAESDFPVSTRTRRLGRWPALGSVAAVVLSLFWIVYGLPGVDSGAPKIAVLPFENVGRAEDARFAQGMTDEIWTRLANVGGLALISLESTSQYRESARPVEEIVRELDADFLLEGSVQTVHAEDGEVVARITPRLIRGSDQTHVWTDLFTVPVQAREIFWVQAQVATQVAQALDVTILESERGVLEALPTANTQAYEAFLRGRGFGTGAAPEEDLRIAVQMYERAVDLDPSFSVAHAALAKAHLHLWWRFYDRSAARLEDAKAALDRALDLDPTLPEAQIAQGFYYYWGFLEFDLALQMFEAARTRRPLSADLLYGIGSVLRRQGRFEEALANLLQAAEVNPRSALVARDIANTYAFMRNRDAAERYFHRAIELDPGWPTYVRDAMRVHLRLDGDLVATRRMLAEARDLGFRHPNLTALSTAVALSEGAYEEALSLLGPLTVDAIESNSFFIPRTQLYAEVHGLLGNDGLRQTYYDSSRIVAEGRRRLTPDDPRVVSAVGVAYAGLGQAAEALREGERAVALSPVEEDAWHGVYRLESLAIIHTMLGEYDAAMDLLEHLLSIPGTLTTRSLEIDYRFKALRDHPRFQELLERYG